jgi:hypothetical protein
VLQPGASLEPISNSDLWSGLKLEGFELAGMLQKGAAAYKELVVFWAATRAAPSQGVPLDDSPDALSGLGLRMVQLPDDLLTSQ